MNSINHRVVETNEIRMHIAESGTGALVVLHHGFPESWYSWRHQLQALAKADFHRAAPDMRGYACSKCDYVGMCTAGKQVVQPAT